MKLKQHSNTFIFLCDGVKVSEVILSVYVGKPLVLYQFTTPSFFDMTEGVQCEVTTDDLGDDQRDGAEVDVKSRSNIGHWQL